MVPEELRRVAARQAGVVTTAQAVAAGMTDTRVSRMVRTGRWQRLHRGVVVTHSGPVGWTAIARGTLLYAGAGAALSHASAAHVLGFERTAPAVLDVSIPGDRRVVAPRGVRVHVRRRMPAVLGGLPVVNRAGTVLDVIRSGATTDDVVGLVCAAVRAGTWPSDVFAALGRRGRHPARALLVELLGEVAEGIESPLELRYQRDVERRHHLPSARLPVRRRTSSGSIRVDRWYEEAGVRVELDGSLAHPGGRTDADTWRDNAALIDHGDLTLRYRWRHVAVTHCATATQVATLLTRRTPTTTATPCSPTCAVGTRTRT